LSLAPKLVKVESVILYQRRRDSEEEAAKKRQRRRGSEEVTDPTPAPPRKGRVQEGMAAH